MFASILTSRRPLWRLVAKGHARGKVFEWTRLDRDRRDDQGDRNVAHVPRRMDRYNSFTAAQWEYAHPYDSHFRIAPRLVVTSDGRGNWTVAVGHGADV